MKEWDEQIKLWQQREHNFSKTPEGIRFHQESIRASVKSMSTSALREASKDILEYPEEYRKACHSELLRRTTGAKPLKLTDLLKR